MSQDGSMDIGHGWVLYSPMCIPFPAICFPNQEKSSKFGKLTDRGEIMKMKHNKVIFFPKKKKSKRI